MRAFVTAGCFATVVAATSAPAQDAPAGGDAPVVGVVLSGGSAKGLAHIGVLEVLEEIGVPVAIVAGTSMGALVGGLYAAGHSAVEIADVTRGVDWRSIFTDRVTRGLLSVDRRLLASGVLVSYPFREGRIALPSGAVRGENVMRLLDRLTWSVQHVREFARLPVPFVAIATDLETGEPVVLTSGNLAGAMRASMSLPAVFEPYRIDGRVLVDGGFVRNLPARDALDLGADFLVCSDVSGTLDPADDLNSLVDVLTQTITFQTAAGTEPQRELCDILIEPDREGLSGSDFDEVDEWIERGRAAALANADALRGLSGRRVPRPGPPAAPLLPDSVSIESVAVEGTDGGRAEDVAERAIDIAPGTPVGPAEVDLAAARLYATGLFSTARYRVEIAGSDTILVFEVEPEASDVIGFGLRYDDHRHASLLFTADFRNRLEYASTLHLEARLGEQLRLAGLYLLAPGTLSRFGRRVEAAYTRAVFDVHERGQPVAEVVTEVVGVSAMAELLISRSTAVGLRVGLEGVDAETTIAPIETDERAAYLTVAALAVRDDYDHRGFPTRGFAYRLRTGWAASGFLDGGDYGLHVAIVDWIAPLDSDTSLRLGGTVRYASGGDVPIHRRFFLGGAYPSPVFAETQPAFWGLSPQERVGDAVQVVRIAVRREVRSGTFLTIGANVGNVFSDWTIRPADYLVGAAVALGFSTLIGPAEATVHTRTLDDWPHLDFSVGFGF